MHWLMRRYDWPTGPPQGYAPPRIRELLAPGVGLVVAVGAIDLRFIRWRLCSDPIPAKQPLPTPGRGRTGRRFSALAGPGRPGTLSTGVGGHLDRKSVV